MELLEEKCETNNILFRKYRDNFSNDSGKKYFIQLLNYNLELISYTIFREFPDFKYKKNIYEVGIVGLIIAIENYDFEKFCSFEEFIVANIKHEIQKSLDEEPILFVTNSENKNSLNYGDIWYSKNHLLDETLETKKLRDQLVKRLIKTL